MTDVQELALRIARIEDERAILDRLHRTAQLFDDEDYAGYAGCFAAHARFEAYAPGAEPRIIEGNAALAVYRPYAVAARRHYVVEPLIALDEAGLTATANSCFLVLEEHHGRPHVRVFGRYADRLVKEEDGSWRLVERRVFGESWLGTPLAAEVSENS